MKTCSNCIHREVCTIRLEEYKKRFTEFLLEHKEIFNKDKNLNPDELIRKFKKTFKKHEKKLAKECKHYLSKEVIETCTNNI